MEISRNFLAVDSSNAGRTYTILLDSASFPTKDFVLTALNEKYQLQIPNFVSITVPIEFKQPLIIVL